MYVLSYMYLCIYFDFGIEKKESESEWRGFESRWFCRSGFEFGKSQLSILNH